MSAEQERLTAQHLLSIMRADTAVILGTGLGIMEEWIRTEKVLSYSDIPGFPVSSVKGHSGRLMFGTLGNERVAVMSGRFHLYEGYTPREVTFPIRVFARMGINKILISNAAGGLRDDLTPGSVMLITDHINLTCMNPLTGPNDEELGPRFPCMTEPYSRSLARKAKEYAGKHDIALKEGVYIQIPGPSMETAAETRMLRNMCADAVGMSTVMEVIQAVHCGMEVLAMSAITNQNDPDDYLPATLEDVISMAGVAGPTIARVFSGVLGG